MNKVLLISLLLFATNAKAVFIDTNYNVEVRPEMVLVAGTFLPFGVTGVRDKYPMIGFYYSNEAFTAPKYEIGLFAANANEVTFYTASLSYKIDVQMYDTLEAFINFGLDAHYYKRKPGVFTEYPFEGSGGAHFGFGTYHELSRNLLFRADFKFNFGPGKTFFAGIGLVTRWDPAPEEEAGAEAPEEE